MKYRRVWIIRSTVTKWFLLNQTERKEVNTWLQSGQVNDIFHSAGFIPKSYDVLLSFMGPQSTNFIVGFRWAGVIHVDEFLNILLKLARYFVVNIVMLFLRYWKFRHSKSNFPHKWLWHPSNDMYISPWKLRRAPIIRICTQRERRRKLRQRKRRP